MNLELRLHEPGHGAWATCGLPREGSLSWGKRKKQDLRREGNTERGRRKCVVGKEGKIVTLNVSNILGTTQCLRKMSLKYKVHINISHEFCPIYKYFLSLVSVPSIVFILLIHT